MLRFDEFFLRKLKILPDQIGDFNDKFYKILTVEMNHNSLSAISDSRSSVTNCPCSQRRFFDQLFFSIQYFLKLFFLPKQTLLLGILLMNLSTHWFAVDALSALKCFAWSKWAWPRTPKEVKQKINRLLLRLCSDCSQCSPCY